MIQTIDLMEMPPRQKLLLGLCIDHIGPVNKITDYRPISYRLIGHIDNRLNRSVKPVFVSFLLVANWVKK
jgi:hypothetical protein